LQKLHEERTAGSADFKYLREDIAALEAMRSQKSLSLNLKTREAERKRIDDQRLERENTWRAAHDVKPVKSLEEIKDDATAGILLDEASQIAADLVVVSAKRAAPTQARRNDTDANPHRQPLAQQ
jgi:carboxyl-terminal processing protease